MQSVRRAVRSLALGIALVTGTAGQVQAQTTVTLVSNTGQTTATFGGSVSPTAQAGQKFTTGSNAQGYGLTSVGVKLSSIETGDVPVVSIWTVDTSGNPGTSVHTLTNPASLTDDAVNTFTAASGATLAKDTSYFVVVGATSGSINVRVTESTAEDAGKASGWSIEDERHFNSTGGSWRTFTA